MNSCSEITALEGNQMAKKRAKRTGSDGSKRGSRSQANWDAFINGPNTPPENNSSEEEPEGDLPEPIDWLDLPSGSTYTDRKAQMSQAEKKAIACYIAQQIITDGGSVFFDAGSTLRMIARATFARAKKKGLNMIIATNNMDIANDFLSIDEPFSPEQDNLSLQLTGGKHDKQHHALFGDIAAAALDRIWPRIIVMGITGFSFKQGLFYHGATEESPIKRALYTKEVQQRVLAFDHSKLGSPDFFLCTDTNRDKKSIDLLCEGVSDKTIIVTSMPDMKSAREKARWDSELKELESGKLSELVRQGRLVMKAVSFDPNPPHYKIDLTIDESGRRSDASKT